MLRWLELSLLIGLNKLRTLHEPLTFTCTHDVCQPRVTIARQSTSPDLLEILDMSFEVCAVGKGRATLRTRKNETQGRVLTVSKIGLAKACCFGVILPESLS